MSFLFFYKMFTYTQNKNVRIGSIRTPHGNIKTPAFLPDATYGAVRMLSFDDIRRVGISQVLCTTLHLHIKPGDEFVKEMGGLHDWIGWNGPILTDSGGWQVFSLIHQTGKGKVSSKGAEFILPNDNSKHLLTPEKSIEIQMNLGSDIVVVLDDPIVGSASRKENQQSVDLTIDWAKRAKKEFLSLNNLTIKQFNNSSLDRPLLFSVVQGGNYKDLRKECAEELIKIGFDGYGFGGGWVEGDFADDDISYPMFKYFAEIIPENKVRYGMGIGKPQDIKYCVNCGFDLFDCVVPTRDGRHGSCYVKDGRLNIRNKRFKKDKDPIEKGCDCPACKIVNGKPQASRSYIRYLLKRKEVTGMRLCALHNLRLYERLMEGFVK